MPDAQYQIQLGSLKNVDSVNEDNYIKIELSQKKDQIVEYDARSVLDVTQVYDNERQANNIYRIHGKIQYLSLLNQLSRDYVNISDLFLQKTTNIKTLVNSFDFYILKPAISGYTNLTTSPINQYISYFEVIGQPKNIELYTAGFSNNLFYNHDYAFNFNIDIDITDYYNNFNFPVTDLYLYAIYKSNINGIGSTDTTYSTEFNLIGSTIVPFTNSPLNIGDRVYGDRIQYVESLYFQTVLEDQTYYIKTPIFSGNTFIDIMWKYNPFIPLKLRYLSDDLKTANISGTTYSEVASITNYATNIGNGNYIWRDILEQGFIDPISGIGVDYPFVNGKRYLFSNIILDVIPNLDDHFTNNLFNEIKFGTSSIFNNKANSDLNNIGKPCA